MKRGEQIIILTVLVLLLLLLLILPFASANIFSNIWGKITGKATSGPASLNITIGNNAPTIPFVEAITAKDPVELSTRSITFYFTAQDADGVSNLNDSTAEAYFQRAGQTTRSNTTCLPGSTSGNQKNYSCTINMWYFDQAGSWTINVTIKDINNAYGENSTTTFTYNSMPAMAISPAALAWAEIGITATDVGSNNDPILINNTGNAEPLNINVTAYNLEGETTSTEYIYANNFTVDNASQGCSGTAMVDTASRNVTNAILMRGNNSIGEGQEEIYFCLKGVPQDISAQSYSTAGTSAWTVEIVA